MKKSSKTAVLVSIIFALAQPLFSQVEVKKSYKVEDVTYTSTGLTKPWALKQKVDVNRDLVFHSEDEVKVYMGKVVQQLENTRMLEDVQASYELGEEQDGVVPVKFNIRVSDSNHILALPKPSYNSNDGLDFKIKAKDSNFLGLMNPFNVDLNTHWGTSDYPDDFSKFTMGLNFDYVFPFTIGPTHNSWSNDFSFSWPLDNYPEFKYATGLTVGVPFKNHSLNFNFTQSITRENDYMTYHDALFFTEYLSVSMPLTVGYFNDVVPISYTPSLSFTANWDFDGLDAANTSITGPTIAQNNSFGLSAVDWKENFRKGYSFSTNASVSYNFATQKIIPFVSIEAQYFSAAKYVGFNARAYGYYTYNDTPNNIGGKLRGVLDNQRTADGSRYALQTDTALQFTMELPIHIVTTDWMGWGYALFGSYDNLPGFFKGLFWLPHKIFPYLNFELQISPFIDIALTHNYITNRVFSLQDGFYTAGFEALIYPSKWKSYVVRISLGFDMGRRLFGDFIDTSWRDPNVKSYEFYFGLGLNF
jgi:outer membrane protein assembly factor BamA